MALAKFVWVVVVYFDGLLQHHGCVGLLHTHLETALRFCSYTDAKKVKVPGHNLCFLR